MPKITPSPQKAANDKTDKEGLPASQPVGAADFDPFSQRGLRVRSCSPMGTFRRGGYAFEREPREIPLNDLTEAQFLAITGETRMLVVEPIYIQAEQESPRQGSIET